MSNNEIVSDEPQLGICDGCGAETMVYPCDGAPLAGGAICEHCRAEGQAILAEHDQRSASLHNRGLDRRLDDMEKMDIGVMPPSPGRERLELLDDISEHDSNGTA